ncbi:ZIP family metal transporter [Pseudomonas putida]|uniref:ZIP family metal transporter n=1 Tax=Pseudomonas TaxID=286 RepID=UPI001059B012|nr:MULTISPECIES: ZIP family metal transporter [Pseudomonas]MBF8748721.1 ZIP family metal transporter [Pseudomonas monteilii]MCT8162243.1 ZIP family metal transporter [Pseudomonas sp. HD6422]MCT8183479.1 ZIP family metal transporter [Pseudomonas sp. HD6421]TDJ74397.1 ZIP family metal transporter [Pseudomonas putida]
MPPANSPAAEPDNLISAWRQQAIDSPWLSAGLGASLLVVLALLAISVWNAVHGEHSQNLHLAALGGLSGFAATALGAVLAVVLRDVSARSQDVMLGFAAGMMLAASSFSLILPGLDAAREITGSGPAAAFTVVLGMGLGVLLMLGLDRFTPHEHESVGACGPHSDRISRVWLFVLAITLHNLPEGMAIGVSFTNGDMNIGLPLTSAIAIQDIPEGLAVAMALRATGLSNLRAALVAIGSGLMEPLGAVIGLGISTGFALAYPVSMGLAAGAMIFVVSHEVIPETHRNGHQTSATLGLMGGFAVMMFLDTALG